MVYVALVVRLYIAIGVLWMESHERGSLAFLRQALGLAHCCFAMARCYATVIGSDAAADNLESVHGPYSR
jgi:hypothetical protein